MLCVFNTTGTAPVVLSIGFYEIEYCTADTQRHTVQWCTHLHTTPSISIFVLVYYSKISSKAVRLVIAALRRRGAVRAARARRSHGQLFSEVLTC